ncbi:hypothetical protein PMAYCL1PPCAC_26984, partial [Pristionchus mayeri]
TRTQPLDSSQSIIHPPSSNANAASSTVASESGGVNGCRSFIRTRGLSAASSLSASGSVVGLRNLGNTCFVNTAVQCLSRVEPLTSTLLRKEKELEVLIRSSDRSDFNVALEYIRLLRVMR